MDEIKRRDFLKLIGAGAASVSVLGAIPLLHGEFRYVRKRTENMYAGMVANDRSVRSTCAGNCTQACGWNAYVKGNMVTGLIQASDYDVYDPAAKDAYNPRGCMRGASYVRYIHGPTRIRHPYKRVGKRGEGKFKRISWDEAMKGIAKQTGDIIEKDGADSLVFFSPIPAYNYISAGAGYRLANVLGASGPLSFYDWYCDLPPGDPITWGTQTEESEEWDWTNAEELIFWGANFAETRMAAAHFVTESKYRGTNLVYIGTDFTATARIADEFISVTPGTDSALTNGVINHIITNKLYDKEYVKLFTDMPFLVRNDDGRFLRENDIAHGGSPFKLYVMDNNAGMPKIAPGCCGDTRESLDLQKFGINPALEGEWSVALKNGKKVKVKTVFSKLKESIKEKTPEWAAKTAGISVETVRNLAQRVATKKTTIVGGGGVNHWYNNDVNNRSMILMLALTGNVGKNGTGFHQYTGQYKVWLKGLGKYGRILKTRPENGTLFVWTHYIMNLWKLGKDFKEILEDIESGRLTNLPGGHADGESAPVSPDPKDHDGYKNYLMIKSLANSWMPVYPKPPKRPKAMFIWRGNFLNQAKGGSQVKKWFDDPEKLELVTVIDFRMNSTAVFADYVLPTATWYEKFDVATTPMHPYLQAQNAAIEPVNETKTDFTIFKDLARAINVEAENRGGLKWFDSKYKKTRDYTKIYNDFIDADGKENPYFKAVCKEGCLETDEMAVHFALKHSPVLYPDPDGYEKYKDQMAPEIRMLIENMLFKGDVDGYIKGLTDLVKKHPIPFPNAQTMKRPLNPWRENIDQKIPFPAGGKMHYQKKNKHNYKVNRLFISTYLGVIPKGGKTLTGRQQFYIDHSTFLTLGEEFPLYNKPETDLLPNGKPAPLKMNTPHERWGTHSMFRDMDLLLRLQRYSTFVAVSSVDAGARGIKDGDIVRVYNAYGEYKTMAKVAPSVKPGEIWMQNGAEMINFVSSWYNAVTPVRPKPTQSVIYPEEKNPPFYHLKYGWNLWGVTGNECDTSVEIEPATTGA